MKKLKEIDIDVIVYTVLFFLTIFIGLVLFILPHLPKAFGIAAISCSVFWLICIYFRKSIERFFYGDYFDRIDNPEKYREEDTPQA